MLETVSSSDPDFEDSAFEQQSHPPEIDVLDRLINYDPTAPEAEHLRPRQAEAVAKFCEYGIQMLQGIRPMEPMSLIHPTGSGKTVFATELARIIASGHNGHNVLMLVPSLQLLGQTVGRDGDIGAIRARVPELSVGEYSGEGRSLGNQVTVMNYQMLDTAIRYGHINSLDPKLVILDEIQHLIDGAWWEDVEQVVKGRLSVGLTATPMYSTKRDSRNNFPVLLDHMTIKEGIKEGILSGIRGYSYEGESRIKLRNSDGKMTDKAIFEALAASKDNYLAAAICAMEVSQGKRGIVSCSPGYDRLHAKVMQRILSQMPVETPDGTRMINAAYVDGDMDQGEVEDILSRYHRKKAEIDVIAFIGMLMEGWDSPLTDFGVWVRPTPSAVLAEQRIGRLLRRRGNKVAHLHEILYKIEGNGQKQITLDDVLNGTGLGGSWSVGKADPERNRYGKSRSLDVARFAINTELAAAIASEMPTAVEDQIIAPEDDVVPYEWPTINILAKKFGLSLEETELVLAENPVEIAQDTKGNVTRTFYSPDVYEIMANHCNMPVGLPEGRNTVQQIIQHCRSSELERIVKAEDLEAHLASLGFEPIVCLMGENIVTTYPEESKKMLSLVPGKRVPRKKKEQATEPHVDIMNWLSTILVNPNTAENPIQKRHIVSAQSCLLGVLRNDNVCAVDDIERLQAEVETLSAEPTQQMLNVMSATNMDFVRLLILATRAKDNWAKLIS